MNNHTPGPWRIWRDMDPKQPLEIAAPSDDNICELRMFNTNAQANARLIAAAPELLAALQMVDRAWSQAGELTPSPDSPLATIRAAIAKATFTPSVSSVA